MAPPWGGISSLINWFINWFLDYGWGNPLNAPPAPQNLVRPSPSQRPPQFWGSHPPCCSPPFPKIPPILGGLTPPLEFLPLPQLPLLIFSDSPPIFWGLAPNFGASPSPPSLSFPPFTEKQTLSSPLCPHQIPKPPNLPNLFFGLRRLRVPVGVCSVFVGLVVAAGPRGARVWGVWGAQGGIFGGFGAQGGFWGGSGWVLGWFLCGFGGSGWDFGAQGWFWGFRVGF